MTSRRNPCRPISHSCENSDRFTLGTVTLGSALSRSRHCYTERMRPKNDLWRRSARRRSSVETLSPRSHWPSSFALSTANISARRFIATATRVSARSTARRGSSTKPTWMASHQARKSFASSGEKRGAPFARQESERLRLRRMKRRLG